jgi:FlaA1/EpsC-like NDP-sugar epimerase
VAHSPDQKTRSVSRAFHLPAEHALPGIRIIPSPRQLVVLVGLLPLFLAVHYAAYWLRFEGRIGEPVQSQIAATIGWVVLAKLVVFVWFGAHQGWSRYLTFHDVFILVQAASVGALVVAFGDYIFFPNYTAPRSVFLMDWGATIFLIGGIRGAGRLVEEHAIAPFLTTNRVPVLIVGVNRSGESLLRAIRRNVKIQYRVVGFISENRSSLKSRIGGVPVIGMLDDTCRLAKKYGISQILIAAGELSGQQVRRLVENARESEIQVNVLPSYEQLISGHVDLRPREVSIEDLLHRDPVTLDTQGLHKWIDNQTLLVTGSAGSIGSEICRQLLQFSPRKLVVVDQSETGQFFLERELRVLAKHIEIVVCIADTCDAMRMNQIFSQQTPDIVFHAAAYKHVPMMEENPGEGIKNITIASRLLADLADQHRVTSFVMISTDKAVNPTSVMGTCKRVAELYVQAFAQNSTCRFVTVRFGNVLDSAGSVVPIFREQIAKGGPVSVTHPDMQRYFMTIPEASQLVIQAGAMGRGGEIFVLDMGKPVRIVDLAADMIRLSGLTVGSDIEIEFTGTRPGEKLYEELRVANEKHVATSHAKIQVVASTPHAFPVIRSQVDALSDLTHASTPEIVHMLNRIVPEFQPSTATKPTSRSAAA